MLMCARPNALRVMQDVKFQQARGAPVDVDERVNPCEMEMRRRVASMKKDTGGRGSCETCSQTP